MSGDGCCTGDAGYIGVSNFLAYRLARALGLSDARRLVKGIVNLSALSSQR